MPRQKSPKAAFDSDRDKLSPRSSAYEALSALNRHLEKVLQNLDRLRESGLFDTRFRRDSLRACQWSIEETRSWINFEITESLQDRAEHDWARFGRLRRQWEKKYQDPNDVLVAAEKRMRKAARKERPK